MSVALMNIVFASHTAFDRHIVVGSHHLSRECALLGHRVLHLSSPVTMLHWMRAFDPLTRRRLHRMRQGAVEIQPGLWEWIPFSPVPWQVANRMNLQKRNRFMPSSKSIRINLERAGMTDGVDLLFIDEPRLFGIEDLLKPNMLAYRATDDYAAIKGDPRIKNAERILCSRVDKIFATSSPVAQQLQCLSGRTVSVIENGVDLRHLRRESREHDTLSNLPRPRVVYVGVIDFRFDLELLVQLATAHPDVVFMNYGPVTISKPEGLPPNLLFPGQLPYDELPSVLQFCDVGFLPLNDHPANQGRSPMKYYEYLAAGLPVLARRTPEIDRRGNQSSYQSATEASQVLRRLLSSPRMGVISIDDQGWQHKAQKLIFQLMNRDPQVSEDPGSLNCQSDQDELTPTPSGVESSCQR